MVCHMLANPGTMQTSDLRQRCDCFIIALYNKASFPMSDDFWY